MYFEDDLFKAQQKVLSFSTEANWFKGFSKEVDKATFAAKTEEYRQRLVAAGGSFSQMKVEDDPHRRYFLATQPPYPETPADLPREQNGVRLLMEVRQAKDPKVLLFDLTLSSDRFALSREVEHRYTYILPFLFSFYADGEAVFPPEPQSYSKFGGASWMLALVEKGEQKKWSLRVSKRSIAKLLGNRRPQALAIVAAFSQRQPDFWSGFGGPFPQGDWLTLGPDDPPQVVVRSNVVEIPWNTAPPNSSPQAK